MSWYNNILYACTLCTLTVHVAVMYTPSFVSHRWFRNSPDFRTSFLPLPVLRVLWPLCGNLTLDNILTLDMIETGNT